jgi:phage major head subunit gpT-like protein
MELSAGNLATLFTGFDMKFQSGFEMAPLLSDKIVTPTSSASTVGLYPFMGRTTKFREWKGERELQNLEAHTYQLVNRDMEDTIGVRVNDIADDQYGVYEKMFEQLGWDTKTLTDMLLGGILKAAIADIDSPTAAAAIFNGWSFKGADVVGYDGNTLFSASHPVGLAGNTTATSNVNTSGGGNPYWFLFDCGRPITGIIWQLREAFKLVRMNAITDEEVFKHKMFRFGVDGRAAIGPALWQLCYASNLDLSNPSNFGLAVAAMEGFKTDAGQPFGAWSSIPTKKFLMVPPALREVGEQLMHGQFGAIEGASGAVAGIPGTNIWLNSATLLVNPYLA